ncbi:MAG: serine/threonine protein kinase [Deltaproteobacteria bacterium]|nr:serine/threonine protein kinase [Deltaproteobacteria bacterium]
MGLSAVFLAPSAQGAADILLETGLTSADRGVVSSYLLALSVFTPASPVDEVTSLLQTLRGGRLDAVVTRQLAQYIAQIPPETWARFQMARGRTTSAVQSQSQRFADAATVAGIFAHHLAPHPVQRLTSDGRVVVVMEASGVGERARPQGSRTGMEETDREISAPNRSRPEAPPAETLSAAKPTAQSLKSFPGEKGSYIVVGNIATAGQGTILLLEDGAHIKYAGKILRDPRQAKRLRDEAKALGNIDNEHVVRLHDIAEIPHPFWGTKEMIVITEYVDGKTLAQLVQEGRRFSEAQLWEITRQTMDGLQAAHAKGIIHRDIKPSNLMIIENADGTFTVKIIDFGFARFEGEARDQSSYSGIKGTFAYTTPEHYKSGLVFSDATDLYGLGLVLIDLIRGKFRDVHFQYDSPLKTIAELRATSERYLSREFLDNLAMLVDKKPEVRRQAKARPTNPPATLPAEVAPAQAVATAVAIAAANASEIMTMGAHQYLQRLHDTEGDRRSAKDFVSQELWQEATVIGGLLATVDTLALYFEKFPPTWGFILAGAGALLAGLGLWKQRQLRHLKPYVEIGSLALYRAGKITGATLKEYQRGAVPLHPVDTAEDLKRAHGGAYIFLNNVVVDNVVVKESRGIVSQPIGEFKTPPPTITTFDLSFTIHLPWGDMIQKSLHMDEGLHKEDVERAKRFVKLFQEGPVSLVGIVQDDGNFKVVHVEKSH